MAVLSPLSLGAAAAMVTAGAIHATQLATATDGAFDSQDSIGPTGCYDGSVTGRTGPQRHSHDTTVWIAPTAARFGA